MYAAGDSGRFETWFKDENNEERTTQPDPIEAVIDNSQVLYALQHPFSSHNVLHDLGIMHGHDY
jgi:hypothetical protein